jgi:hypothetical protein
MVRTVKVMAFSLVVTAVLCGGLRLVLAQASTEQRQKEEKAAEKKLADINKNMDELAMEAKKSEGKTQAELNRLYEEFKKQQGVAMKDLEALRKSTNESWEKAKVDMDQSLKNLNGLYERSKAKAKDNGKDTAK